jgi:hypothetical protein
MSERGLIIDSAVDLQKMSRIPSLIDSCVGETAQHTYEFHDLPIAIHILPSTLACTSLYGKIYYIFDLGEVQKGQLLITEAATGKTDPKYQRVDIQQLTQVARLEVSCKENSKSLCISVHDADGHGLHMTFTWLGHKTSTSHCV